jgi:hypothetical protein
VRVLDHAEKRSLRGPFSEEPKRREADQEQVRSIALDDPERRLERASLWVGKEI